MNPCGVEGGGRGEGGNTKGKSLSALCWNQNFVLPIITSLNVVPLSCEGNLNVYSLFH